MNPTRPARGWLCLVLLAVAARAPATFADNRLAPTHTIDLGAKLVHPTPGSRGDYLYWLNQSDGKLQRAALADATLDAKAVELAPGARDFCLSPDGTTAYVAATTNEYSAYRSDAEQRGTIQTINLADMAVTGSFDVAIDPFEIVCDAKGFLYVTPGSGQWVKIAKISPAKSSVLFSFGQIYGRSNLRITPSRGRLYLATNGLSPGNLSAVPTPLDAAAGATANPVNSPYHGDYPLGGEFEITPDGRFIVNRAGIVVRLGTVKGSDMLYVTKVEPNLATAADPAGGRFWVATADGRLITYKYPSFELDKTEVLVSHGESLAYDAAHTTLWVAWAAQIGGIGGLDAYDLKNPAGYPNDITKARETPVRAPTPVAAPTSAPSSQPSGPIAHTPAEPATPPNPRYVSEAVREENLAAVHRDKFVAGFLGACGLFFFATLFASRRAPTETALRSGEGAEDPRNWPLPGAIKFVGWFGWFQAIAIAAVILMIGFPGEQANALKLARIMSAVAAIAGGLSWGVLRGSKVCYVAYALFLIAGLVASVSQGGSPGFITIILVFIVLHYGRKHWDSLS